MTTSATHKPKASKVHKTDHFIEGRGGRKTAISRVRVTLGKGPITVNEKSVKEYFKMPKHQEMIYAPFKLLSLDSYSVSARVTGGGVSAQAEAVRNGIAQALTLMNAEFRPRLKHAGFLIRDPRVVERKKYGLKKARRAPQWAKR